MDCERPCSWTLLPPRPRLSPSWPCPSCAGVAPGCRQPTGSLRHRCPLHGEDVCRGRYLALPTCGRWTISPEAFWQWYPHQTWARIALQTTTPPDTSNQCQQRWKRSSYKWRMERMKKILTTWPPQGRRDRRSAYRGLVRPALLSLRRPQGNQVSPMGTAL